MSPVAIFAFGAFFVAVPALWLVARRLRAEVEVSRAEDMLAAEIDGLAAREVNAAAGPRSRAVPSVGHPEPRV